MRYDNAHGYTHRDLLDQEGHNIEKKYIGGTPASVLQYAIADITTNREQYRQDFVGRMQ